MNPKKYLALRIIGLTVLAIYIFALLYLTVLERIYLGVVTGMFTEDYRLNLSFYYKYSVNLIPFKTIYGYLVNPPNQHVALTNIIGNVLAFLPLGFLIPAVFRGLRSFKKILMLSIVTSVLIELIQMLLRVGITDIDDVLLNTLGGIVGYTLVMGVFKIVNRYSLRKISKTGRGKAIF